MISYWEEWLLFCDERARMSSCIQIPKVIRWECFFCGKEIPDRVCNCPEFKKVTEMSEPQKSVLDNVPVQESTAFKDMCGTKENPPKGERVFGSGSLNIVSSCPHCGSPIYGPIELKEGEAPSVIRSCDCWTRKGAVSQNYETK